MEYNIFAMTITQLEYFVATVKQNSITKAAKNLYISQAAVSFAIKELEKEFNTALFVRYNNQIVLTDEGHHLYKLAIALLEDYNNTCEDMKNYIKKSSVLKIGIPPMIGSFVVPSVVQEFAEKNPNTEVQLVELGSVANQKAIIDKELSCGFTVKHKDNISPELDYIKVGDTSLLFVTNKSNPLSKKTEIAISDIKNTPLILMKEDCLQSTLIQSEFEKHNLVPNIKIRTNQLYTIKELLLGNKLGAFLFSQVCKQNEDDIVAIPLKDPLDFEIILAWGKNSTLNESTRSFIEFIKNRKSNDPKAE